MCAESRDGFAVDISNVASTQRYGTHTYDQTG